MGINKNRIKWEWEKNIMKIQWNGNRLEYKYNTVEHTESRIEENKNRPT
jgi:hypothetical protein